MIAVRVLARADWERILRDKNCKPYDGPYPLSLKTAEVWQTENGSIFFVPMDNGEGRLRAEDLHEVLIQVAKVKPLDIYD